MTGDPKDQLSAVLALTGSAGALVALDHAIAWAQESLRAQAAEDDEVAALRLVIELDDALAGLRKLLDLVPGIVEIASPGRKVHDRIADRQAQVDRLHGELAAQRAALDEVGDLEQQLAAIEAERDQLAARVSMLERRDQLAAELPALQARLAAVQEAVDDATDAQADQLASGLAAAAGRLAELTTEQRTLVGTELAGLIDDAAAAGAALADETRRHDEVAAEITSRRTEAEQLQHELEHTVSELVQYQRADEAVADGLTIGGVPLADSALARVREALAEITQRLSNLDDLLKPLLEGHARAYADARRVRSWSGY
jgi:chromosome segregation ATPase